MSKRPAESENPAPEKEAQTTGQKRAHRATFSRDKKKGGYLVRVEGLNATAFAGREVPVTLRDGSEALHKLLGIIWSGKDKESGKPVALYEFEQKPRGVEEIEF